MPRILGYAVTESKNGTVGTTIALETEFDSYRQETAIKCVGNDCVQEYIRGDYSSMLKVGQLVNLVYGKGYQGKAVLQEIIPINEK